MKEKKWDQYLMSKGCEVTSSTMEGDKSAVEPQIDGVTLIKQLFYCDGESGTDATSHLTGWPMMPSAPLSETRSASCCCFTARRLDDSNLSACSQLLR